MFRIDLCYTPWHTATTDRWFGTNPSWDAGDWFACCRGDNVLVRTEGSRTGCDDVLRCFGIVGNGKDNV